MRDRFSRFSIMILCISLSFISTVGAADDWQSVPTPDWISVKIPQGWTILDDLTLTDDNKTATFSARSPDWKSELYYILEHTGKEMSMDLMEEYQNSWMQNNGYRICQTKDPVKRQKSDHSCIKQVYVQGTDKGAVMYSATYPEWGRYHVALLMTGEKAVEQYYDTIPALIPDHVLPVLITKDEEIGLISFSPVSGV